MVTILACIWWTFCAVGTGFYFGWLVGKNAAVKQEMDSRAKKNLTLFMKNQVDLPADIGDAVNEHFWDLI